jgi:peptide chain release factor 3
MTGYQEQPRRSFAIISHPDAGKTTLTEKFLFIGDAIRSAGTVKGKKSNQYATSDWMQIEKQRGISVTSTVLRFSYDGFQINLLDTPGHEDFSEDTYRTLTAVDSVVMVIDAAKGVEPQTKKLFKVCRMRGIPIFTFINKLDRHGKGLLALLEEIEETLGIESYPMNWPIGTGTDFCGIYDRVTNKLELHKGHAKGSSFDVSPKGIEHDQRAQEVLGTSLYNQLTEDVALLDVAGNQFHREKVDNGTLTPVFFGSALNSFGVESFLQQFLTLSADPQPRKSNIGIVKPETPFFTGFIFKVQANMNPNHRDRIAFLRICSGKFERGMSVALTRTGKTIRLSESQQFLASQRQQVEEAYPGDIIGLYDPGLYQIGDTLCDGKEKVQFEPLPQFPPELFAKVAIKNAMKQKHFQKGIRQLAQEGAIQIYRSYSTEEAILGAVGVLQFEVFQYRMKEEYGVDVQLQRLSYQIAKWLDQEAPDSDLYRDAQSFFVKDSRENPVILFENEFSLRWFQDKHPKVRLLSALERNET